MIIVDLDCWRSSSSSFSWGRPPLKANDAFSPNFGFFPLFRIFQNLKIFFQLLKKIFQTFSKKCMFHPPKFLITLLVIDSQFVISPHFRKNATFPTICAKLLFPPISLNWIVQISISFNLRVFAYFTWFSLHPYFDHRHFLHHYNARTGRLCFLVVLFSSLLRYFDFALLSEIIVLFTRRQCPLARSLATMPRSYSLLQICLGL